MNVVYDIHRKVRNGYEAAAKKLVQRFPFDNEVLQSVQILNPKRRLEYDQAEGNFFYSMVLLLAYK